MTRTLTIMVGLILAATAARSCERSDIEGDWLLSAQYAGPRCHLSVAPTSSRVVCISASTGTEGMTGDIAIVDSERCILVGRFFRGDEERLTFTIGKQIEGHALYGGASFPVSFVRP